MIFLSPRDWLALWPRRLQLFVAILASLSALAPTWHVCEMGGHVMGEHGAHGHARFAVENNADGTPGPVICACAAPRHEIAGNAFSAKPSRDHVNCLALLLQTMPLHGAAAPALWQLPAMRAHFAAPVRVARAFEAPLSQRGRSPPAEC